MSVLLQGLASTPETEDIRILSSAEMKETWTNRAVEISKQCNSIDSSAGDVCPHQLSIPTVNTEEKYSDHWNLKPDDYHMFIVTLIHLVCYRIRYSPVFELFTSSGLILVDKKAGR